jgi:hypothetical protein
VLLQSDLVKTRLHRAKESIRDLLVGRVNARAGEAFRFYAPRCDREESASAQFAEERPRIGRILPW